MFYDDLLLLQMTTDSEDLYNIRFKNSGLMKALLLDAIEILQGNVRIHLKKVMYNPVLLEKHTQKLKEETKAWILDDNENPYPKYMFTFREVCEYLHFKPSYVRDVLRKKNLL